MSESINLVVLVATGAVKTTNQLSNYPEVKCPPGYVQRLKSFAFIRMPDATGTPAHITAGLNGVDLKIGSRTIAEIDGFTSGNQQGTGTADGTSSKYVKGLIPVDDIWYPGEELGAYCLTAATNYPAMLFLAMERVSIEELQADAKAR